MRHIASFQPYYNRRSGSTFGKVVATIATLVAIAAMLFIGTREWKSGKSFTASLIDISDIRSLLGKIEKDNEVELEKQAAINQAGNDVERALIEKGTLIRRSTQLNTQETPAGLTRQIANR